MQLTLASTLDDSVIRHPYQLTRNYLCEPTVNTLCRNAIYGDPIVISSAFLVQNRVLFGLFKSRKDNILKAMMRHSRIYVLTDTGDLIQDQIEKAKEHEHMALSLMRNRSLFDDFKVASKNLYGPSTHNYRHSLLLTSNKQRESHDRMRRILVEKILKTDEPSDLGLTISHKTLLAFSNLLSEKLKLFTPRSACELAIEEAVKRNLLFLGDTKATLTDQIMTFANEAFYLSRAASMTDGSENEILVETNYSERFCNEIPYVSSKPVNDEKASVRVPTISLLSNRNHIIDKIFSDPKLRNCRDMYSKNKNSRSYAVAYENAISDAIGMKKSTTEKIDEKTKGYETCVTAGSVGLAIIYTICKELIKREKKINKRNLLKLVKSAGIFAITSECVIETYGPNLFADFIAKYTSIEGVDQRAFHDVEIEKIVDEAISQSVPELVEVSTNAMSCAPMGALRVDIGSIRHRDWKKSESIL